MQKVGKVTKVCQKAVKFLDNNGLYNFKLFVKVIREKFHFFGKTQASQKKHCQFQENNK